MEAAGIVLGALPLLISAVENYEVTFQPFVTFFRHIDEMKKFRCRLGTQKTIFRNQCQLLLSRIDENLSEILHDTDNYYRNNPLVLKRLDELLGASYDACISTVGLISEALHKVMEETAGFREIVENEKGKSSISKIRLRLKISIAKSRLSAIVDELRVHNKDFETLSNQIAGLKALPSTQAFDFDNGSTLGYSRFKFAQQASEGLFRNLDSEWSCDKRIQHVASMSLQLGDCLQNKASKVGFSLALKCAQPASEKSVGLVIESAPNVSYDQDPIGKSFVELQDVLSTSAKGKRVQFSLPTRPTTTSKTTIQPHNPQGLIDTQIHGKLCQYFRDLDSSSVGDSCVGYLEKPKSFKHFVYPKPVISPSIGIPHTASLKEVLHSTFQEKKEEDCMVKLKLAKLLSLAVLQFHSTPWLSDSWSSNDIRFFWDHTLANQSNRLQNPCVDVQLSSDATPGRKNILDLKQPTLAPNEPLFNLAIVLIELGYDAPFESLHGGDLSDSRTNTELLAARKSFAARRLCDALYRRPMLNMNYQRIVDRCLHCNFGVGRELDDAELQKAVYIHVVSELENCLKTQSQANKLYPRLLGV